MALPFPEDAFDLELSPTEKIVIDDVIKYGIEELQKGEKATIYTKFVSDKQLDEFGQTFSDYLNAVYQSNTNAFYPLSPIETQSYICFPFVYRYLQKSTWRSEKLNRTM